MRRPAAICITALALLAACDSDPFDPVSDPVPVSLSPTRVADPATSVLSSATPAIENMLSGSFTFLAPLPALPTTGAFEDQLLTSLSVEVCSTTSCDGPPAAVYSSSAGSGSEILRLDAEKEHFIVNWSPSSLGLPSPGTYRITVLAAGLPLGHVDVELVSDGRALKRASGETIALVDNRTLPVKFTVRRNAVIAAWLAAAGGADAQEVAGLLLSEFGASGGDVAVILDFAGYPAADIVSALAAAGFTTADIVDVLKDSLGRDAVAVLDAAIAAGLPVEDVSAAVMSSFDVSIAELAGLLADRGWTADPLIALLRDLGADAFDVASMLAAEFDPSLESIATRMKANGYDGDAVLDALYRVATEVLGDPVGFALETAVAAMRGAGYTLDDFRDTLLDGARAWTQEHVTDALGLSGYALSDIVPFMLDVMGLTVQTLMAKAESWGVPMPEIVGALVEARASIIDIMAGAQSAYDATAAAAAQALADAGATAVEIGTALVEVYDQTLDEVAATLEQIGTAADKVFDAVYRISTEVFHNAPDFALRVSLAVMRGAGYTLDRFRDALVGRLHEWTEEQLIEAFQLSGFALADLFSFMRDTMHWTTERIVQIAERWGVPASEVIAIMVGAGESLADIGPHVISVYRLTADQFAEALKAAGLEGMSLADIGAWLHELFGLGWEGTISILHSLGATLGELIDVLVDVYGISFEAASALLLSLGYALTEIAALWPG